jgi:hypothetical protein
MPSLACAASDSCRGEKLPAVVFPCIPQHRTLSLHSFAAAGPPPMHLKDCMLSHLWRRGSGGARYLRRGELREDTPQLLKQLREGLLAGHADLRMHCKESTS